MDLLTPIMPWTLTLVTPSLEPSSCLPVAQSPGGLNSNPVCPNPPLSPSTLHPLRLLRKPSGFDNSCMTSNRTLVILLPSSSTIVGLNSWSRTLSTTAIQNTSMSDTISSMNVWQMAPLSFTQ